MSDDEYTEQRNAGLTEGMGGPNYALEIRVTLTASTEEEAANQSELIADAVSKALPPGCAIVQSEEYTY